MSTHPQDLMDAIMHPKRTATSAFIADTTGRALAEKNATLDAIRAYARTLYAEGSAAIDNPNSLTSALNNAVIKRSIAANLLTILRNAGAAPKAATKSTPST